MVRWLMIVAMITGLLVLIQAIMAGRFLSYPSTSLQRTHGDIGSLVFLLAIIQVVLVFLAGITGKVRAGLLGMTILLLILVGAQLGLGYSGRDNQMPRSLHIPNGVLIFGLAMSNISMAMRAQRDIADS
jgi:hypothetical protein